ncbi:XRE family transcriptional regulator [Fulvivirga ulvae]|uniref:helix-turn-helix domain-containing protein n=1 Tax=Fulvivirga ulvae TaxID=2904245 RepID=UPI001F42945E|nr:XRE family transcriptional regulator [Fulvivirga ulvae]UII29580.1 XRE family transcriptional regulator [Fulvivirga ulvae]
MKQEFISSIGRKIKEERLKANLTIRDISERSGLSKGLISKIENSRSIPSMPVFFSILKSMSIAPVKFFEGIDCADDDGHILIKPANHEPLLKEERPGFHYRYIMSRQLHDINIEVVLLELEPGVKGKATSTDGFELKYLLKGRVAYRLAEKTIILEEGDTLYFDASKPHRPENLLNTNALMLVFYFMYPKS